MNSKRIGLMVVAALLLPGSARAQGVNAQDVKAHGSRVELLGVEPEGAWGFERLSMAQALSQVPPDDSGKWHLTIFAQPGCTACGRLEQDLREDPELAALAGWCHTNVYDLNSRSQRFRFRHWLGQQWQSAAVPQIFLSPPRNSDRWPFVQVFHQTGYDADARGLARRILKALGKFLKRTLGPRPAPQPEPALPNLSPLLPNLNPLLPDRDRLPDFPPLGPDWAEGDYPDYPEVVIVSDPRGVGEKLKVLAAERIVNRIQEKYDLRMKVRVVELEEAAEQYPMVGPSDTPAIIVTRGGRLITFISASIMDTLHGTTLAQPIDEEAGAMGRLASGAGGGLLVVALGAGLWGLNRWRRRRAK